MVDARLPLAISLAKGGAAHCPDPTTDAAPASPATPARGTALGTDMNVVEILVRCIWPGDDEHSSHVESGHEYTFPALRKAERRSHSSPPQLIYDTFVKKGDPSFERIYTPSMYCDEPDSLDIVVTQPTPGGGSIEVTVAVKK